MDIYTARNFQKKLYRASPYKKYTGLLCYEGDKLIYTVSHRIAKEFDVPVLIHEESALRIYLNSKEGIKSYFEIITKENSEEMSTEIGTKRKIPSGVYLTEIIKID